MRVLGYSDVKDQEGVLNQSQALGVRGGGKGRCGRGIGTIQSGGKTEKSVGRSHLVWEKRSVGRYQPKIYTRWTEPKYLKVK